MATIKQKITDDHANIMNAGDLDQQIKAAKEVGDLAIKAIKGGMGSSAWALYMFRYADNLQQLKRLCGEDKDFMDENDWAEECLVYAVGNGVCTINSRRGDVVDTTGEVKQNQGTLNYLTDEMLAGLEL